MTQNVDEQIEVKAGLKGIVKSMVALAASDRNIDDREVEAIGAIFNNLTGQNLDPVEVRQVSENYRKENWSIRNMLEGIEEQIDPEFKKIIVRACYLVCMADEILVQVELDEVRNVGSYLKVDPKTVDELIIEMEKLFQAEHPYN